MTKYEKKIYDIVSASREHLTAERIFDELKKVYPGVSRATVYNNLNKLCDVRLVRRISGEGASDRFDHIDRHDHLVCQECKELVDINLGDLTEQIKKQLGMDFLSYDLRVFYTCPECRKNS